MIKFDTKMTNLEMTRSIERYLAKRLKKLDKFVAKDDTSAHAQIELAKTLVGQNKGEIFRAEINLHRSGGQLYASSEKEDIYDAIDEMQEEIIRQLKKEKGKRENMIRRGGRRLKSLLRRS